MVASTNGLGRSTRSRCVTWDVSGTFFFPHMSQCVLRILRISIQGLSKPLRPRPSKCKANHLLGNGSHGRSQRQRSHSPCNVLATSNRPPLIRHFGRTPNSRRETTSLRLYHRSDQYPRNPQPPILHSGALLRARNRTARIIPLLLLQLQTRLVRSPRNRRPIRSGLRGSRPLTTALSPRFRLSVLTLSPRYQIRFWAP